MAQTTLKVFISYSRKDIDFALRLQADLESRGINAWVDVRRLEGGQDWSQVIQNAINSCQVMVLILSPDSVESEWVKREITYAQRLRKPIIPLMYRKTDVLFEINELHFINFTTDYNQGILELQIALSPINIPARNETIISSPIPLSEIPAVPTTLVTPNPSPPPPNPELNSLYQAGVIAATQHDYDASVQ